MEYDLRGRVQVPTGGIVRDPQRCGGIGDFLKQKEFRYRQYSLDERRQFCSYEYWVLSLIYIDYEVNLRFPGT